MPSSICLQEELADVLDLKRQVDSCIVTVIIIIILSDSTYKSKSSHGGYDQLVSKIIITSGTQQSTLNDQELKDIINAIIESRDRYEQSKSLELVKRYNELLSKLEPLGK